jgi:hypothetical protein
MTVAPRSPCGAVRPLLRLRSAHGTTALYCHSDICDRSLGTLRKDAALAAWREADDPGAEVGELVETISTIWQRTIFPHD